MGSEVRKILFGYNLNDYDELFSEKLELLLRLRQTERVTWSGKHRPALIGQRCTRARTRTKFQYW